MPLYVPDNSVWTPFGMFAPYNSTGADTTISGATNTSNQIQYYKDLIINSSQVLTANFSPQIIIARSISFGNTSSQISANGKGAVGGAAVVGGPGLGGNGCRWGTAVNVNAFSAGGVGASVPMEMDLGELLAAGGTGGSNAVPTPTAGVAAASSALFWLMMQPYQAGIGGGGGGSGGSATGSGSAGSPGVRGAAGQTPSSSRSAGGGGSGVGGGGGGGAAATAGSGTSGAGGTGGGVLIIICDTVLTAAGLITANGANGTAGSGASGGGGAGGGGGLVLVYARNLITTPTLQANGGSGGAGSGAGAATGGAGGAGLTALLA